MQKDKSATLSTMCDQVLFAPVPKNKNGGGNAAGFCTEHSAKARSVGFEMEKSPTLRAGVVPAVVYAVENHPNDSRINIDESGTIQTLTSRMGTGGGNVPLVMVKGVGNVPLVMVKGGVPLLIPYRKSRRAASVSDFETWVKCDKANAINLFDLGDVRSTNLVVYVMSHGAVSETEITKTLDVTCGTPYTNQGGR